MVHWTVTTEVLVSELVVLGELPREWTLDDLALLPDDGHRYEIVDGGLHVSPPPGAPHQFAATELCFRLRLATPPDLAVTQGLGLDLGRTTLIPDLVVVPRRAVPGAALVRPADVLLAVEIVSPSSVSMDRLLKPARYAEAGIQSYWRVDGVNGDEPSIAVYDLDGIHYRETAVVHASEQVEVDRPFRVTLAPAQLVP
jgi:Uma2 family endonuclease